MCGEEGQDTEDSTHVPTSNVQSLLQGQAVGLLSVVHKTVANRNNVRLLPACAPGPHNDNSFLAALVKEKMQGIFALSPAERDAAETNSKVLLGKPLIAKRTQRTSFDLV